VPPSACRPIQMVRRQRQRSLASKRDIIEMSSPRLSHSLPAPSPTGLTVRGLYSIVAHPIMTGLLLGPPAPAPPDTAPLTTLSCAGFWATPNMTASRLLLAAFNTTYVVAAVKLLEGTAVLAPAMQY
jgi:hypothetical protein